MNDKIRVLQQLGNSVEQANMKIKSLDDSINERAAQLKASDSMIQDWEAQKGSLGQRRRNLESEYYALANIVSKAGLDYWMVNGGKKKVLGGVVQIVQTQSPLHVNEPEAVATILQAVLAEAIPIGEAVVMLKISRSNVVKAYKRDCIVAREILHYKDVTKARILPGGLVDWKQGG